MQDTPLSLNEIKREFLYLSDQEASSLYYNKCRNHKPLHIADASGQRKESDNTIPPDHNTIPPMSLSTVNNKIREGTRTLRLETGIALPHDYCRALIELVSLLGDPPNWTKWPPELPEEPSPSEEEPPPLEERQQVIEFISQPAPEEPPPARPPLSSLSEGISSLPPAIRNILISIAVLLLLFGAWLVFQFIRGIPTVIHQDPPEIAQEGLSTPTIEPSITPDRTATNDAQRTGVAQSFIEATETELARPTATETPTPTITPTPTVTDTPSPTNTPTVPPTIPPPEFFDDFSDGIDTSWLIEFGATEASIVDGQLVASGDFKMSVGDERWTDYFIEVDIASATGDSPTANHVSVRKTFNQEVAAGFIGRGPSSIFVLRGGVWSGVPNTSWSNPEGPRLMRVEAVGEIISVIINSTLVKTYRTDYPNGRVALKLTTGTVVNSFRVSPVTSP